MHQYRVLFLVISYGVRSEDLCFGPQEQDHCLAAWYMELTLNNKTLYPNIPDPLLAISISLQYFTIQLVQ